ncbi:MAG: UDP-N-acetylmuramate dehydrogenase [Halioglobus sp.]
MAYDQSLSAFNTLALDSTCKTLVSVFSESELIEALAWARKQQLAVTVLGGGSNVVLAGDLETLVILQKMTGITILSRTDNRVLVRFSAGENWHDCVSWALDNSFFGLENLALIPGSVGAAPIQNIGAYGVEIQSMVAAVHAIKVSDGSNMLLSRDDCQFGYRDSIFKHGYADQLVITAVDLQLDLQANPNTSYPALAHVLAQTEHAEVSPRDVFDAVVDIRRRKLPDPVHLPNAGSFFKNPVVISSRWQALEKDFPDLPGYAQADGSVKLPAAWLIDHCGWKGRRVGGLGVHPDHALVLVNYDSGSGSELLELARRIAADVKQTFDIALEIEPRVYGSQRE